MRGVERGRHGAQGEVDPRVAKQLQLKLTSHVAVAAAPPAAGAVRLLVGHPGLSTRPEVHHARLEEKHPGLSPTGPGGR